MALLFYRPFVTRAVTRFHVIFGKNRTANKEERTLRLFTYIAGMCRCLGLTREKAQAILDYVYTRESLDLKDQAGRAICEITVADDQLNLGLHTCLCETLDKYTDNVVEERRLYAELPPGIKVSSYE